jgi:hypothetical protein
MKEMRPAFCRFQWLICLAAAAGLFCLASACGKKAPPLPPAEYALPAVDSLAAEVADGELVLRWPFPDWEGPAGVELAGFYVYRAKVDLESACPGCPVSYQRAGQVRMDAVSDALGADLNYREKLEEGHHYRYKVTAFTRSGREGADSNVVRLDYPQTGKSG